MDNKFYEAVCFLDREIKNVLLKIEKNIAENVSEIRLRCERPVALTLFDGRSVYLKENGTVTERPFENESKRQFSLNSSHSAFVAMRTVFMLAATECIGTNRQQNRVAARSIPQANNRSLKRSF